MGRRRVDHAVEDGLPPHFALHVAREAPLDAGIRKRGCDGSGPIVLLDEHVAGHGVLSHAGLQENGAVLNDGAQDERGAADRLSYDVLRVEAVLKAEHRVRAIEQRHDWRHGLAAVADLGRQDDQAARDERLQPRRRLDPEEARLGAGEPKAAFADGVHLRRPPDDGDLVTRGKLRRTHAANGSRADDHDSHR
jgi:hypothetical protein